MAKAPKKQRKTDLVIGGAGFAGLGARYRAAPGPRRHAFRHGDRSGAGRGAVEGTRARPPSLRPRGGCSRPSASGTRWPANAQPILDMVVTRLETRRHGAADFLYLRWRSRRGRTLRAHDREPASDRCAGDRRRKSWASIARRRGQRISKRAPTPSMSR